MHPERDLDYQALVKNQSSICPPESMDSEDPLFILYTSGSTGKPKGVLHTSGGYLTYAAYTHEIVFDYKPEDIYWCAADIGWVTGHSYIVYGPLANGATSVLYEGLPTYPDASRIWQIIDQLKVNTLYTAPTLIRSLMREGDDFVKKTKRTSLRILGSVGEPINPEAWAWYYQVAADGRCPIVDTWWQTETGGILISPLPGATDLKPGSATKPLFGIEPLLVDDKGQILDGAQTGHLCLKRSWPGQMRTVYGDHSRFEETYFSQFTGLYYAGDECHRDEGGDYWIIGRADDVINVSGHRLGTAEVESALLNHPSVAESAVVGYPHSIKGQGIYAFVTLKNGVKESDLLKAELIDVVKKSIGALAKPDKVQWATALPKTRSGKIMRRILKKIAANDYKDLGDTTTLADPFVVENLIQNRMQ
jgi:acetyl-CoA synthetase